MDATARVILVRHGQCEANLARRSLGRADSPLTDLGRRQAAAVADALRRESIVRVIASPLSRAADTAAAIAGPHGLAVEPHDGLLEMDIGDMEGLDWSDARERFGDFLDRWMGDDTATLAMPGGESLRDVCRRAWPVLAPLLEDLSPSPSADPNAAIPAAATPGVTVLVSHNFVVKTLICAALELDLNHWRRFETDLTGRTTLERRRGQTVVRTLNDFSHLGDDLIPG